MNKAPKVDHGKAFERWLNDQMRDIYTQLPIKWERVIDSHDAGNVIGKSDCDFKLTINSGCKGRPWVFFIECKASIKYKSLTDPGALRSLVKATQFAKLTLAERAGATSLILFREVVNGKGEAIEIWPISKVPYKVKRVKWKPDKILHLGGVLDLVRTFCEKSEPEGYYSQIIGE